MCGLFGAISSGSLLKTERENVETLAVLSTFRGTDSTGIAFGSATGRWNNKKYQYRIAKSPEDGLAFCKWNKSYLEAKHTHGVFMMMGHTRYGTVGDNSKENAHPYWESNIIGAHNGTIPRLTPAPSYENGKKTQGTDSRVLVGLIAKKGFEEAAKEIGPDGHFALTWVDRDDNSLNMCRNDKRTLFLMADNKRGTLYWASERIFLDFMRIRSEHAYEDYSQPVLIATDTWIKFDKEDLEPTEKKIDWKSHLEVKPVVMGPSRIPVHHDTSVPVVPRIKQLDPVAFAKDVVDSLPPWEDPKPTKEQEEAKAALINHLENKIATRIESQRILTAAEVVAKRKEVPKKEYEAYRGHMQLLMPIDKVNWLLNTGCFCCSYPRDIKDDVWWYDTQHWVCDDCSKKDFTKNLVGANNELYRGVYITDQKDVGKVQMVRRFEIA